MGGLLSKWDWDGQLIRKKKKNKHGRILASQYIPKQTPDGLWSLVSKHYTIKELNGDIREPDPGRVKGFLSSTKGKEAE